MTREEAITNLNMIKIAFVLPVTKEQRELINDTFDMAISALEQPCEDAVSRDAALEKMSDYVASGYAESVKDFEEYSKIICQLPSVTVCDIEQIKSDIKDRLDDSNNYIIKQDAYNEVMDIINHYTKGAQE